MQLNAGVGAFVKSVAGGNFRQKIFASQGYSVICNIFFSKPKSTTHEYYTYNYQRDGGTACAASYHCLIS